MNYIYDILLNFNKELYDFYEWNKNDFIIHIKKIPLIRISSMKLKDIINHNIIFSDNFLEKIQNKTEEYCNRKIKNLDKVFLLTDGLDVIGINISDGISYSKLLIDEEIEVLEIATKIKESVIEYKKVSKKNIKEFKTRKEIEEEKYVISELNNIIKKNDSNQLRYLYYECFNKRCFDDEIVKKELLNNVINNEILNKINNYFRLKKCIKY